MDLADIAKTGRDVDALAVQGEVPHGSRTHILVTIELRDEALRNCRDILKNQVAVIERPALDVGAG
jgi:hypothetical protein